MENTRVRLWTILGCSAALFYIVSYGPLFYCMTSLGEVGPFGRGVIQGVFVIYSPHAWLQENTQFYYEYMGWWHHLAHPEVQQVPWGEVQQWQPYPPLSR